MILKTIESWKRFCSTLILEPGRASVQRAGLAARSCWFVSGEKMGGLVTVGRNGLIWAVYGRIILAKKTFPLSVLKAQAITVESYSRHQSFATVWFEDQRPTNLNGDGFSRRNCRRSNVIDVWVDLRIMLLLLIMFSMSPR